MTAVDHFLVACSLLGLAEFFGIAPVAVMGRQIRAALEILMFGEKGSDSDGKGEGTDVPLSWYSFWSRVWLSDVDFWGHKNNCRYYQRCEEGRFHMLMRSGLHKYMGKNNIKAGLAGC